LCLVPNDENGKRSTLAAVWGRGAWLDFALSFWCNHVMQPHMDDVNEVADDTIIEPAKLITKKLLTIERDFFSSVPNMIAALVFLLLAWIAGKLLTIVIERVAAQRGRPDLGHILGFIARGILNLVALLLAAAMVFPGVSIATVFSALGIGSVAVGFAFKDILQNLFSGLLILINRPIRPGDIVRLMGFEGIVLAIEPAVTVLKTFDGRKLLIPNSDVYTTAVVVTTGYPQRRDEFTFWIDYAQVPDTAAQLFADAIRAVEGVAENPAVLVQVAIFAPHAIQMVAYWWADASGDRRIKTRDAVVSAIHHTAAAHSVSLRVTDAPVVLPATA